MFIRLLIKDFKLIFSLKKTLLLVGLCLCIFFLMTLIYKGTTLQQGILDQVKVGLVDEENSTLSRMLLQNFKSNEAFSKLFYLEADSEENLFKAFNQNELTAIVYIPNGFTESLLHYENLPIRVLLNPHNSLKNQVLVSTLSSFSEYIASVDSATYNTWLVLKSRLSTEELTRMNEVYSVQMISFALNRQQFFDFKPITTIPSASPQLYFFLSIIIILSSFLSIQGALQLFNEWDSRCLQRFFISPQSRFQFVLSKLISTVIIHFLIILVISWVIGSLIKLNLFPMLPFLLITLITFTSISLFAATLFKERSFVLNGLSLLFLLFAIIGGNFIPLQLLPESVQVIARITPQYWLIQLGLFLTKGFEIHLNTLLYLLIINLGCLTLLPYTLSKKGGQL